MPHILVFTTCYAQYISCLNSSLLSHLWTTPPCADPCDLQSLKSLPINPCTALKRLPAYQWPKFFSFLPSWYHTKEIAQLPSKSRQDSYLSSFYPENPAHPCEISSLLFLISSARSGIRTHGLRFTRALLYPWAILAFWTIDYRNNIKRSRAMKKAEGWKSKAEGY